MPIFYKNNKNDLKNDLGCIVSVGVLMIQFNLVEPCNVDKQSYFEEINSLVNFLRTSPARSILDRMCSSVSDAVGVMTTTIVLHLDSQTEVIAMHGVWMVNYIQSFSSPRQSAQNLGCFFEVEDIQTDQRFSDFEYMRRNPNWRYAARVMIAHKYADQADLELWCADERRFVADGSRLTTMMKQTKFIGDVIALIIELWKSQRDIATRDRDQIKLLLATGVAHSSFCAALVDEKLNIIVASPALTAYQVEWGGPTFVANQPLTQFWLDGGSALAANVAIQTGTPILGGTTRPSGTNHNAEFDFMTTRFGTDAARFGLFTVRREQRLEPEAQQQLVSIQRRSFDGDQPLCQFLFETLIKRTRIHQRNSQTYISARSWRKPIKAHQLAAFKALKADAPAHLIDAIADDLIATATQVYGTNIAKYVVPVPCGHSGGTCFSVQIAQAVAAKMGLEFVEVFERQNLSGVSHPKQNVRRPRMKVQTIIDGAAILVDDVATSGTHVEEAARLLQKSSSAVWPIVWIAD